MEPRSSLLIESIYSYEESTDSMIVPCITITIDIIPYVVIRGRIKSTATHYNYRSKIRAAGAIIINNNYNSVIPVAPSFKSRNMLNQQIF